MDLKTKLYHWNTQTQNAESFSNFIPIITPIVIVNNLHYNLFHLVKWVQQP